MSARPIADITVTGTATLIQADDSTRLRLHVTNTHATVHARWGDASVTATKGQRIPALATKEIDASGPIYMISEGADVTVSGTVESK
jgi:hypothetical protein